MLNGLDLFSGIGGLSIGLAQWVRTIAYCERDVYAQSVLLSRMHEGRLHRAPIWDDVQTLKGDMLPPVDIIFGGFPCQDISVAGNGVGLAGKRSGLFFEILRLAEEIKPTFIFLENVPAIRTRGLDRVVGELSDRGYDSRWCALSAQEVGANHKRNRWFLLASHTERLKLREQPGGSCGARWQQTPFSRIDGEVQSLAHTPRTRLQSGVSEGGHEAQLAVTADISEVANAQCDRLQEWWATEPNLGRVVNGLSNRVDRIRCLGNAVVPAQAREAFKRLSGM